MGLLTIVKCGEIRMGQFIVIEAHGGAEYAIVCMDEDGNTIVFNSEQEAQRFADEECQYGIVVEV